MSSLPAELVALASSTIHTLFSNPSSAPFTPIAAFDLLIRIITSNTSTNPRFRLTDQLLFQSILRELAQSWPHGRIHVTPDASSVLDVKLGVQTSAPAGRKRKRVKDDTDDSAAEDEYEEEPVVLSTMPDDGGMAYTTTLGALGQEMHEAYAILQRGTAKGRLVAEEHQSADKSFDPICPNITKDQCSKSRSPSSPSSSSICDRVHFRPLIRPHTDQTLGHCSYLNTCYSEPTYSQSPSISISTLSSSHNNPFTTHSAARASGVGAGAAMNSAPGMRPVSLPSGLGAGGRGKEKAPCRYLHFEVDWDAGDGPGAWAWEESRRKRREREGRRAKAARMSLGLGRGPDGPMSRTYPPQWINCDLRRFDYSVLGKFHVIMADPPWDIHMSLPYGTMTDDEMRAMPIPTLQDEGLLFLWVTGRAMEVGRECLRVWGYTRVDEVIWVKTNQLQRVIRTGRTGHWLNHTKEHMLVGIKQSPSSSSSSSSQDGAATLTFPKWANRGLDTDVIVSEVRETSRKPDEVYGVIERMCPGGRKIEIFGRKHNTRPGWLTLGNQLGPDQIFEEELKERIKARYPERAAVGLPAGLPAAPSWV